MRFTPEHYNDFQQFYANESDRSVAILAATYLEQCLEEYLLLRLVDHPSVRALFAGFAPLATFSGKIEVAFAIGLLPVNVRDDLRRIKKIRNLFAHELEPLAFDSPQIRDLCGAFFWPRSDGTKALAKTPRTQYLNAVFWCLLHVYTERDRTSRLLIPRFHFEEVVEKRETDAEANSGPHPSSGTAPQASVS